MCNWRRGQLGGGAFSSVFHPPPAHPRARLLLSSTGWTRLSFFLLGYRLADIHPSSAYRRPGWSFKLLGFFSVKGGGRIPAVYVRRKVPPLLLIGGTDNPASGVASVEEQVDPCSPPPPLSCVRAPHMCEARLAPQNALPRGSRGLGSLGKAGRREPIIQ